MLFEHSSFTTRRRRGPASRPPVNSPRSARGASLLGCVSTAALRAGRRRWPSSSGHPSCSAKTSAAGGQTSISCSSPLASRGSSRAATSAARSSRRIATWTGGVLMPTTNGASATFIATDPADADILSRLGASVRHVSELRPGVADGDVVLIARGDGRDLLIGMNLAATGRFLDLGADGSLETLIQGHPEPLGLLDEMAHDIFWHEERPLSAWTVPEQSKTEPCGYDFLHPYLRWWCPELVANAGPYGCGKSTLNRLLAYRWADTVGRKQNARLSIVGWEDKIHTIKREVLRYSLGGDVATLNSAQAVRLADMEGRIGWTQRHPDDARLIQWYCELVEHRAKYDRVRFFIFDPFNEHDST